MVILIRCAEHHPWSARGAFGCSRTSVFTFFNNIFMRVNTAYQTAKKGSECVSGRKAKPLKKTACFLRGLPRLRHVGEAVTDENSAPDLQGKTLRSFNIRVIRDRDSGGFWIFDRYPNWTFRDSGHFCPRKIPLRPLLLFETGQIQTATVAQLGQEKL